MSKLTKKVEAEIADIFKKFNISPEGQKQIIQFAEDTFEKFEEAYFKEAIAHFDPKSRRNLLKLYKESKKKEQGQCPKA